MQNGIHMQGTRPNNPNNTHKHIWLDEISLVAAVVISLLQWPHHTFETGVLLLIILCLSFYSLISCDWIYKFTLGGGAI